MCECRSVLVPTLPGLHLPRGSGSGAATELVPGSFAWPASQDCPGIRGTSEGLCSSYPGAVPPSHTLFHYTHSGCAPTLRPLPLACLGPSRQAPSLAAAPPPAAEAPDGDSSRSAHGPQTPPRSSRRSLPSLPAAAARLGRLASRPSSSAVSDWDGSPAAKRYAGAVLGGGAPQPQVRSREGEHREEIC